MIDDLTDLEPLLSQFDPGTILVGPLRGRSINSSFLCFGIAGNGNKIYESIGIGFVETEADAQRQRSGIVEKLKSQFVEVIVLDSDLEMARMAHQLWPNQETTRALLAATLEMKLKSMNEAGGKESIDDGGIVGVVPERYGEQLVDEVAQDPVTDATSVDPALTNAALSRADQRPPMTASQPPQTLASLSLPNVNSTWPLRGARVLTRQQTASGLDEDVVASASLGLKSAEESIPRSIGERGTRSITQFSLRFCAIGGVAALAICLMVLASTRKFTHEPVPTPISAPVTSVNRDNGALPGPSVPPSQIVQERANKSTPQAEPEAVSATPSSPLPPEVSTAAAVPASKPQSEPEQMMRAQAGAAAVSQPQSPPARTESAQAEARPIAEPSPASAAAAPVSQPQSPPAQIGNAQAGTGPIAEPSPASAGAAPVSQPQSPPAQTVHAQAETEPVAEPAASVSQPSPPAQTERTQAGTGPIVEPSPASAAAAPVSQPQSPPTQTERAQNGAGPVSAPPSPPAQVASAQTALASAPPSPPPQTASAEVRAVPGSSSSSPHQVASAEAEAAPSEPQSPPAPQNGAVAPLNAGEITMLISRARDFLKSADFASARLLLRRAAEAGNANAALMLGETFDPLVMHELGAIGIKPDSSQARRWYEKAAELGSDIAAQRLAKLPQTGQ